MIYYDSLIGPLLFTSKADVVCMAWTARTHVIGLHYSQNTALPAIHINESPLDWWKVEATRFPLLAFVTKGYLAIPATSVPSERVFSTAGDVVTDQRARLTPENVYMLQLQGSQTSAI